MNAKISARILSLVQTGKTLPEAMDVVMGAGTFAKLAGEVYDNFNAKGA